MIATLREIGIGVRVRPPSNFIDGYDNGGKSSVFRCFRGMRTVTNNDMLREGRLQRGASVRVLGLGHDDGVDNVNYAI